jgi:CubicO group peptidase (beta-lactamase class C family)
LPTTIEPGLIFLLTRARVRAGGVKKLSVLGVLIARSSGQAFDTFLQERIFEPLGMKDTAFSVPASKLDRLATSYATNSETGALELYDPAEGGQWSRPPAFQGACSNLPR